MLYHPLGQLGAAGAFFGESGFWSGLPGHSAKSFEPVRVKSGRMQSSSSPLLLHIMLLQNTLLSLVLGMLLADRDLSSGPFSLNREGMRSGRVLANLTHTVSRRHVYDYSLGRPEAHRRSSHESISPASSLAISRE